MIFTQFRPQLAGRLLLAAELVLAAPAAAAPEFALRLNGPAETMADTVQVLADYALPVGPFADGKVPARRVEGSLSEQAWRLPATSETTLALLQPLRDQILAAGFALIFECEAESCGGFDFRYGTPVLPEPQMHVDLGDFRFLAAQRSGPQGDEYLTLLVSRSPLDGYVQLTTIGVAGATVSPTDPLAGSPDADVPGAEAAAPVSAAQTLEGPDGAGMAALAAGMPVVLDGLVFASGAANLEPGDYAALAELAGWLQAHPDRSAMLVGHTDASGSLAANVALSRKRAEAVRQMLIARYGVAAGQVVADGAGPLAPRASNLDEAGRQQNRRVEVFLTGGN